MKDKSLKQLTREWVLVGLENNYRIFIKGDMDGSMNDELTFDTSGKTDVGFVCSYLKGLGLKLQRNDMVEIGCGAGRMGKYFDKYFRRYTGIDISSSIIDRAKERCPDIDFRVANSLDEFGDGSKDVIFSYATLQHMPKWCVRKYFKEALRVLGRNGIFVFQLPRGNSNRTTPKYGSKKEELYDATSFREWTDEEFDDLIKDYNLVNTLQMNDTSTFYIVQK
jgi:SAM-dependent methyltransferase